MKYTRFSLFTLAVILLSGAARAEEANYATDTLTGDWGGLRTKLSEHGIDTEIVYKADIFANVEGGKKRGTRALDNLDVLATIDGEKLMGWKGGSALVHFINNNGGRPDADLTGSAQGIDNIETPRASRRLYQAWVQQSLFDEKVTVLAGLYDLNSEFYVTESSLLFIHSTYGIGTEIAQSGLNGPSIFPYTSLTGRVRVQPTHDVYAQVAVMDAVPGDPENPRGTHITWHGRDGALIVGEAGFNPGMEPGTGKIAVGAWTYTHDLDELQSSSAASAPGKSRSQGAYIIGETPLWAEAPGSSKGLTAFVHFGVADEDTNQFDYAWATGLVYTGLIPTRDEGQLGLGIAGAHNSDRFREIAAADGARVNTAETAIELTYSDRLTPWLAIQPDIQYIINPGTDPALDNALTIGTRLAIAF